MEVKITAEVSPILKEHGFNEVTFHIEPEINYYLVEDRFLFLVLTAESSPNRCFFERADELTRTGWIHLLAKEAKEGYRQTTRDVWQYRLPKIDTVSNTV